MPVISDLEYLSAQIKRRGIWAEDPHRIERLHVISAAITDIQEFALTMRDSALGPAVAAARDLLAQARMPVANHIARHQFQASDIRHSRIAVDIERLQAAGVIGRAGS